MNDILKKLAAYRDSFGLLTQKNKDGGDTANRTGILYALLGLADAHNDDMGRLIGPGFRIDLNKLSVQDGIFRRHPDQSKWYSWQGCFSRDQHSQLILAAAVLKDYKSLLKLTMYFPLRLLFHQNTFDMGPTSKRVLPDILSPGELTTIIRGFHLYPLYPLLLILDMLLCFDNYFRKTNTWGADNLIAARLCFDLKRMPTPFTFLNKHLYRRDNYIDEIELYYSEDNGNNGIQPLGDLYRAVAGPIISG